MWHYPLAWHGSNLAAPARQQLTADSFAVQYRAHPERTVKWLEQLEVPLVPRAHGALATTAHLWLLTWGPSIFQGELTKQRI